MRQLQQVRPIRPKSKASASRRLCQFMCRNDKISRKVHCQYVVSIRFYGIHCGYNFTGLVKAYCFQNIRGYKANPAGESAGITLKHPFSSEARLLLHWLLLQQRMYGSANC